MTSRSKQIPRCGMIFYCLLHPTRSTENSKTIRHTDGIPHGSTTRQYLHPDSGQAHRIRLSFRHPASPYIHQNGHEEWTWTAVTTLHLRILVAWHDQAPDPARPPRHQPGGGTRHLHHDSTMTHSPGPTAHRKKKRSSGKTEVWCLSENIPCHFRLDLLLLPYYTSRPHCPSSSLASSYHTNGSPARAKAFIAIC
jgi:hypothetical protein